MKRLVLVFIITIFYSNTFSQNSTYTLEEMLLDAVRKDNQNKVDELISTGANVNARFVCEYTALHYAANNPDISKLLITNGANVNAQDEFGNTPLMSAITKENIDVINILLENGATLPLKDKYGNSALDIANKKGNKEIIELLGGDMNNLSKETTQPKINKIVIAKSGNIRKGPSTQEDIIGKVTPGTNLIQVEKAEDWYNVRLADQNTGWIHKMIIASIDEIDVKSVQYIFDSGNGNYIATQMGELGYYANANGLEPYVVEPCVHIFKDVPPHLAEDVKKGGAYFNEDDVWMFIRFVDLSLSSEEAAAQFGVYVDD